MTSFCKINRYFASFSTGGNRARSRRRNEHKEGYQVDTGEASTRRQRRCFIRGDSAAQGAQGDFTRDIPGVSLALGLWILMLIYSLMFRGLALIHLKRNDEAEKVCGRQDGLLTISATSMHIAYNPPTSLQSKVSRGYIRRQRTGASWLAS